MTADLTTVQEPTTHRFRIELKSVIPGSAPGGVTSNILPGIHIYFPPSLIKDPANQASNPINIVGYTSQINTLGSPTFQIDQTLTYNEEC